MVTILKYTFKEMLKKKVFTVAVLLALLYLGLYGWAIYMTYADGGLDDLLVRATVFSQLLGAGFYFASFILAFLAILGGIGAIAPEIESGILYGILTKPITRTQYLIGKISGISLMLAIFSQFMLFSVLGINIAFAGDALINFNVLSIIKGAAVYCLIPLSLLSVVIFFSIYFKALAAGIFTAILFILGVIGGFLEQIGAIVNKEELVNIGIVSSLFSPADSIYRKFMSLLFEEGSSLLSVISVGPFGTGTHPSVWMILYVIIYIFIFIVLTIKYFNNLDL